MSLRFAVLLLGVGLLGLVLPPTTRGQGATTADQGVVLAEFEDATGLAVDPRGRLYVTDAGRDVVVTLSPEGERLMTLGGSGSRAGEFDLPADVDPTNGQVIAVADAYNGRVQRFSEEGQYLESVPVGEAEGVRALDRAFDDGRDGAAVRGDGRPIAIASLGGGGLITLDAARGVVYRWTEPGGLESIVGGSMRGRHLQRPVDLAVGIRDRMYVADGGREEVVVYDRFGTFIRTLPTPRLSNLRSIALSRGTVWITCTDRLVAWEVQSEGVRERTFGLQEKLVKVVPYSNGLYVLTESHLVRYSNG